MDQETLIKGIGEHLGELDSLLKTTFFIAVIVYWSGIRGHKNIGVIGLKLSRRYASFIVGVVFFVLNVEILVHLLRLAAILAQVESANIPKALTVLATHKWILNPFAYFGSTLFNQFVSVWGFGLLLVVWWFCYTAFNLLWPEDEKNKSRSDRVRSIISWAFLVMGLASCGAISYVLLEAGRLAQASTTGMLSEYGDALSARMIIMFLGIFIGNGMYWVSVRARNRVHEASEGDVTTQGNRRKPRQSRRTYRQNADDQAGEPKPEEQDHGTTTP